MAKTVFTGKKIKKFPCDKLFTFFRFPDAIFPWFPKDILMSDCPCNTGYGQRHKKKISDLLMQVFHKWLKCFVTLANTAYDTI